MAGRALADYADDAIESLKCCGNCDEFDDTEEFYCPLADEMVFGEYQCILTPSRWQERSR
jgi:hypothetical protein